MTSLLYRCSWSWNYMIRQVAIIHWRRGFSMEYKCCPAIEKILLSYIPLPICATCRCGWCFHMLYQQLELGKCWLLGKCSISSWRPVIRHEWGSPLRLVRQHAFLYATCHSCIRRFTGTERTITCMAPPLHCYKPNVQGNSCPHVWFPIAGQTPLLRLSSFARGLPSAPATVPRVPSPCSRHFAGMASHWGPQRWACCRTLGIWSQGFPALLVLEVRPCLQSS